MWSLVDLGRKKLETFVHAPLVLTFRYVRYVREEALGPEHYYPGTTERKTICDVRVLYSCNILRLLNCSKFILLLGLFVKPMLISVQGTTQSEGAVYRRVVSRNVTCTAGIVTSYVIATAFSAWIFLATPSTGSGKVWHHV